MHTYEITKSDGTTVSLAASGYSWDKPEGAVRFFDAEGNKVAAYRSGEWIALHMRSPLIKADPPKTTGITHAEFTQLYGH